MIGDSLGAFLRDRRERLDPVALGLERGRRRTPGLRREEVAQRANVSATWYTWLEQGRGGQPSTPALNRLADALMLQPVEREHLFTIARQRPNEQIYPVQERISTRLQHVLDSLENSPAYIKNVTTNLVAWNYAATVILDDYIDAAFRGLSILQYIFCDPTARLRTLNWELDTRFAVAAFRMQATRSGHSDDIGNLVDNLCRESAEFENLWAESEVISYGEGNRQIFHPDAGLLDFEYSTFSVNGEPSLMLVVYTPATENDICHIRQFIKNYSSKRSP